MFVGCGIIAPLAEWQTFYCKFRAKECQAKGAFLQCEKRKKIAAGKLIQNPGHDFRI
jgi:hypothetical protein